MNDKQQIEEMAKDMGIAFQLAGTTRFDAVAEILVDKWQPKIPKDAVVLTREEYNELLARPLETMGDLVSSKIKRSRK